MIFDRKNYFYPDLSKGYQITQDRTPLCKGGYLAIHSQDGSEKNIELNRIHLEEDAGKLVHIDGEDSLVDFNRAGVPLIEIVTEPCITCAEDAGALLAEIRKTVRYLDICDGNMEEGSLRCDANVSIMLKEAKDFGTKVEIKNMNSIRNVQHAIEHEVERQVALLQKGESVVSETRNYDASTGLTHGMRTKEELNDYRYFPDPDLSPVEISESWLKEIQDAMPALPNQLKEKFITEYNLPVYDALVLSDSKEVAGYFERVCESTTHFKAASNWVMGPVKSCLNELRISMEEFPVPASVLAELITLVDEGKVSYTVASQRVFSELLGSPNQSAFKIAERLNLIQDSNQDSILPIVEEVVKEFPLKVEEFKSGKKGIMQMFMGEVMKRSRGKADPRVANELLLKKLK
jgi:aspartyl-tRNA(Asn)/glutamyl-tRNA(Gln) amidotransferase subunit B